MAIGLHFKDGTTASIGLGASIQPYPGNDHFYQVMNNLTPPVAIAFGPTCNLEWAEIDN